jgi:hypothetical protein
MYKRDKKEYNNNRLLPKDINSNRYPSHRFYKQGNSYIWVREDSIAGYYKYIESILYYYLFSRYHSFLSVSFTHYHTYFLEPETKEKSYCSYISHFQFYFINGANKKTRNKNPESTVHLTHLLINKNRSNRKSWQRKRYTAPTD